MYIHIYIHIHIYIYFSIGNTLVSYKSLRLSLSLYIYPLPYTYNGCGRGYLYGDDLVHANHARWFGLGSNSARDFNEPTHDLAQTKSSIHPHILLTLGSDIVSTAMPSGVAEATSETTSCMHAL